MKRVGIVGEHYDHDAGALKKLLEHKYNADEVLFVPLLKTLKGKQLNRIRKVKELLEREMQRHNLDFIVYVRDLDGLPSEQEKINKLEKWFQQVRVDNNGFLFILIFELEALILADIQTFNQLYKVKISFKTNPLHKPNPKEFLKAQTAKTNKKYHESHTSEIFEASDFDEIISKHKGKQSFQSFIQELDEKLGI